MKRILFSSTIAATLMCSTSHLMAADYDYGVVTKSPAETYTDVEFGSGWYLRGDITFNSRGKSENTIAPVGDSDDQFNVQVDYDDVIGAKAGFGYQFNPYLRMDATVAGSMKGKIDGIRSQGFGGSRVREFIQNETVYTINEDGESVPSVVSNELTETVHFNSDGKVVGTSNGNYQGETIAPIGGSSEVDAEYSASNFIVNGYLDLPLNDKIVPYVGAGAGFARVNYHETRTLNCVPDDTSACAFPAGNYGEATEITLTRDEEFWAFAYQLSVGTAIKLTDRTSLDLGYTYLNVAGGEDLSYENGIPINEDGFAIHQGSIGLRYDIN